MHLAYWRLRTTDLKHKISSISQDPVYNPDLAWIITSGLQNNFSLNHSYIHLPVGVDYAYVMSQKNQRLTKRIFNENRFRLETLPFPDLIDGTDSESITLAARNSFAGREARRIGTGGFSHWKPNKRFRSREWRLLFAVNMQLASKFPRERKITWWSIEIKNENVCSWQWRAGTKYTTCLKYPSRLSPFAPLTRVK